MLRKMTFFVLIGLLLATGAFASNQLGRGIIQRAEVNEGITAGGTIGIASWPGIWSIFNVGLAGEYGFSDENPSDSIFTLGNLAAGFSISYDRTRINLGSGWNNYVWRYSNTKFGPYAKYEFLNPDSSYDIFGRDWASFYFSTAAGFKLNFDSYGSSSTSQQLEGSASISNTFLVDLFLLADYPLSNLIDDGFFSDVTLTLGTGVINNRFTSTLAGWYDTPNFSISAGYRFLLGAEVNVIVPF